MSIPFQQPQQPTATTWRPGAPVPPADRTPAAVAHGASLVAGILSVGWLSFVGPLVMWVLYKDRSPYVREAAAGAFNFNLWVNLVLVIGQVLFWSVIGAPVGLPLIVFAAVLMVWTHLRGVLRSLAGKPYTYRHQLRILN